MNQLSDEETGTPTALRRLLPSALKTNALIADIIEAEVAKAFGLTIEQLRTNCRVRTIAWPRQVAMRLMRDFTILNTQEIGLRFARDHGTVLYAFKLVESLTESHDQLAKEINEIRGRIVEIIETEGL